MIIRQKLQQRKLLGDLSQGIHAYRAIKDWDEVLEHVFDKSKSNYMTLEQSYRATIEIMNLANQVIKQYKNPNIILAKPVIRHGNIPLVRALDTVEELLKEVQEKVQEKVQDLTKENFKSIALICKTNDECIKVKKHLDRNKINSHLLKEDDSNYEAGVVVVPSYLAKGLEFDAVIIINSEEEYLEEELDIKLLYVAMTRPMHRLYVFYRKIPCPY